MLTTQERTIMIFRITIQVWWYDYDTILEVHRIFQNKFAIFPLPTDWTWIVILKRQSCLLLGFPLLHQLWYNPSTWFKSSHPSRKPHPDGEKGGEISFAFVEAEALFLGKKPGSEKKSLANGVFSMNDLCRWWRIRISSFKNLNFMKLSRRCLLENQLKQTKRSKKSKEIKVHHLI